MAVQISGNDITVPRDTTVTRNLTVGGVLTYEDVTNVDSVGLVTARSGIEIGARPGVAASISVDGNMIISGISTFGDDVKINVDSKKILLGAGADLEVFHNGTNSHLRTQTGNLIIDNNSGGTINIRPKIGEEGVVCTTDGSTALYHDGTKKFETTSSGATVTGQLLASSGFKVNDGVHMILGTDNDFKLYHDGSNAAWLNTTGNNYLYGSGGNFYIRPVNGESSIDAIANGAITLYHDGTKKFETTANGVEVDGELKIDPDAGGTIFFTGLSAHHSKMVITDNAGSGNGNLLIEGGDGSDFLQIASNGDIDIAEAVGTTLSAKVAIQHGGINPSGLIVLSSHASFQSTTLQSAANRNTTNTSYNHFKCSINGVADKMFVRDSGNIQNTNNSYGAISDVNLKENIVDASSQWDDIKALRIRKFNFKEGVDPAKPTLLGVVAQEAELVCPNLVTSEVSMQEGEEKEYKTFKYSILYMKAIKCLQEAQTKIETLESRLDAAGL